MTNGAILFNSCGKIILSKQVDNTLIINANSLTLTSLFKKIFFQLIKLKKKKKKIFFPVGGKFGPSGNKGPEAQVAGFFPYFP